METQFKCPKCNRPLMSRHHKHCQYCGAELPEHLLATQAEIDAELQARKRAESQRQKRRAESDAEDEARSARIESITDSLL